MLTMSSTRVTCESPVEICVICEICGLYLGMVSRSPFRPVAVSPRRRVAPLPSTLLREHQLRGYVRSGYEHNQDERSGPSQLDQMRVRVFTEPVNEFC